MDQRVTFLKIEKLQINFLSMSKLQIMRLDLVRVKKGVAIMMMSTVMNEAYLQQRHFAMSEMKKVPVDC